MQPAAELKPTIVAYTWTEAYTIGGGRLLYNHFWGYLHFPSEEASLRRITFIRNSLSSFSYVVFDGALADSIPHNHIKKITRTIGVGLFLRSLYCMKYVQKMGTNSKSFFLKKTYKILA